MAVAFALPPLPLAVAVYVVEAVGLTACVPPAAVRLYVLPSDPLSVTSVAFVAVTVRVEEFPITIDDGAAVIVTVGI